MRNIDTIKQIFASKTGKTLLGNFSYLSLIEIAGILFPLITYPYIIRVVGAEKYGAIIFAQAIISYVIVVVNFGFNVSATRRVSENRYNTNELCLIFSSIIFLKIFIASFSIIFTILILYFMGYQNIWLFLLLLGLCVQEVFYPTWLFQGIEQMNFITIITLISRTLFLILIFVMIHDSSDYYIIPVLYSLGGLVTSILSLLIAYRKFGIHFTFVTRQRFYQDFKESLPFFASRLSTVIMDRSNVILIGVFFTYDMVSIYDLCIKVVSIAKTPFSLVAQVIYPNVAKSKNMKIVKSTIIPILIFGFIVSFLICVFSDYIILLLGGNSLLAGAPVLRILSLYVPVVGISYLFGASVLVVKGHSNDYNLSVIYSVLLYVVIILVCLSFSVVNIYSMALAFLLPELYVALRRSFLVKKYNLLN